MVAKIACTSRSDKGGCATNLPKDFELLPWLEELHQRVLGSAPDTPRRYTLTSLLRNAETINLLPQLHRY